MYQAYVRQFVRSPLSIDAYCYSPLAEASQTRYYDARYPLAPSSTSWNAQAGLLTCGVTNWNLSAWKLAKIATYMRHAEWLPPNQHILSAAMRQVMDSLEMGWEPGSNLFSDTGKYWHGGARLSGALKAVVPVSGGWMQVDAEREARSCIANRNTWQNGESSGAPPFFTRGVRVHGLGYYNERMAGRECYHCKQRIEEGEAHDCWTTTEAALTKDLPEDLQDAWERLRETAADLGEQRIYASHKSIMFSRTSCYFFVRPKKRFLEACVFLGREVKAPQVRRVDQVSKSKFAHIIPVQHRDQVEPPLTDWLREAYELSSGIAPADGNGKPKPGNASESKSRPVSHTAWAAKSRKSVRAVQRR